MLIRGDWAQELERRSELREAREMLQFWLPALSPVERFAIKALLLGVSDRDAARIGGVGQLSRGAIECLRTLARYGPRIFPRQATLARRMGRTRQAVSGYLRELRSVGLVEIVRVSPTHTVYNLKNQEFTEMFFTSVRAMSAGGVLEARRRGLAKLRAGLVAMGISGSRDLVSDSRSSI